MATQTPAQQLSGTSERVDYAAAEAFTVAQQRELAQESWHSWMIFAIAGNCQVGRTGPGCLCHRNRHACFRRLRTSVPYARPLRRRPARAIHGYRVTEAPTMC